MRLYHIARGVCERKDNKTIYLIIIRISRNKKPPFRAGSCQKVCQKLKRYSVTQEALDVNHFDISLYNPSDILTASQIHELFLSIADEYFPTMKRLPLAGHNIQFDSAFLKEMYFKNKLPYDKTFATRVVDTFSLLQFLIHLDLIPAEINYSTVAFDYFNIKVNGRHTALGDSVATAELYTQLLNLIKSKLK